MTLQDFTKLLLRNKKVKNFIGIVDPKTMLDILLKYKISLILSKDQNINTYFKNWP